MIICLINAYPKLNKVIVNDIVPCAEVVVILNCIIKWLFGYFTLSDASLVIISKIIKREQVDDSRVDRKYSLCELL